MKANAMIVQKIRSLRFTIENYEGGTGILNKYTKLYLYMSKRAKLNPQKKLPEGSFSLFTTQSLKAGQELNDTFLCLTTPMPYLVVF